MIEKKNIENFNYISMFNIAREFSDTATLVVGKNSIEKQGWSRPYIIPEMVNRAFSCEVFLKSLLVFSNADFKKKHELKDLWDLLSTEIKDLVKKEIALRFEFTEKDGFEDLLEISTNAFVRWRYVYEVGALTGFPGFLAAFSDSLREVCCKKYYNRTWKEYKEML